MEQLQFKPLGLLQTTSCLHRYACLLPAPLLFPWECYSPVQYAGDLPIPDVSLSLTDLVGRLDAIRGLSAFDCPHELSSSSECLQVLRGTEHQPWTHTMAKLARFLRAAGHCYASTGTQAGFCAHASVVLVFVPLPILHITKLCLSIISAAKLYVEKLVLCSTTLQWNHQL